MKHVRCNSDVAPRRNYGRDAYVWNVMSVDFQYVVVYLMWSMIIIAIITVIIIIIIVIIIIVVVVVIIIIIPFEDNLMLLSGSAYSRQGEEDFWSLMRISWCYYHIYHSCRREWWYFWSLMKISWCNFLLNIFVQGVVDLLISSEDKTY